MTHQGERLSRPRARARAGVDIRALAFAAHRLGGLTSLAEVTSVGAHLAREVLDAHAVAVCRIEQDSSRPLAIEPSPESLGLGESAWTTLRAADRPALQHLIRDRRTWTAHLAQDPDTAGTAPDLPVGDPIELATLERYGWRSILATPIIVNGTVWGQVLAVRDGDQDRFGVDDAARAEVFAALLAAAIARVDLHEQVRHLVADDPLTGLATRRVADEAVDSALDSGAETCVVMCDVDGLKRVNDDLGHDAGDDLLRSVADVLRRAADALPGTATAARIGGDEFCVVVVGVPRSVVAQVMDQTVTEFALPYGASLSYGIAATTGSSHESSRTLFRRADAAQYHAKRSRAAERSRLNRVTTPAAQVERLISTGISAMLAARSGTITRLCALAAATTETMGGTTWAVLRDTGDGEAAAVARGGTATTSSEPTRAVSVARAPWVLEVEVALAAADDATLVDALQTLVDVAVHGSR
ncbi:diguanylate cyclase domain-containing protein [Cellulomonas hominis]